MVTIAHAAAFSKDDTVPFEHGVALAIASGGKLCSVHAQEGAEGEDSVQHPSEVLERWGDAGSAVSFERITHSCCDDPVDTVLDALRKLSPDLVIAGTRQREGLMRLLMGSRAEAIAHNVSVPTLLLPFGGEGFVDPKTGTLQMSQMLLPVGDERAAEAAFAAARMLGEMAGAKQLELVLLHVGDPEQTPKVEPELPAGWTTQVVQAGDRKLEDAILDQASKAAVVVMATRGHDSLGDVVLGSHTERVLHRSTKPVLSVPID